MANKGMSPNILQYIRGHKNITMTLGYTVKCQLMQSIFQKENADTPCRYRIYRHLPTYEKIIKFNISFYNKKTDIPIEIICLILIYVPILHLYKVYIGFFLLLASIFNII